jgi:hypothetical protein
MVPVQQNPPSRFRLPRRHYGTVVALAGVLFACVLLMRGEGGPWVDRISTALLTLVRAGLLPLLYLLAAMGYGRLARRALPAQRGRWCIELGLGLTALLSLSHLLGVLGILSTLTAALSVGVGVVLFAPTLRRAEDLEYRPRTLTPIHFAISCAVALALVMACNPPGVLWASEYGGFDALSYHLQLPREWIAMGRVWPSEHNVYSFLPSYIEAAYMHVALLGGGGILGSNAQAAMSAQLLSAYMLIASGLVIAELTRATLDRLRLDADRGLAWLIAMSLTLGTPWLLVVGTLAYNEIAVVLLGSTALCAAMRMDLAVWKRALICGVIVGGACSCKPTALFLLAPSVGIVLLACSPRKRWLIATTACLVTGGITIAPWLIRNELATGNPVFPQMAGVFGGGHWSEAQHAVYVAAHAFEGSLADRFAMLVVPDRDGVNHVSRFRGLTNGQWGITVLLGLIGLTVLIAQRRTRAAGVIILLTLGVPIVLWALLTHLQSRFLIPISPILVVLGAVGVTRITNEHARNAVAKVVSLIAVMTCVVVSLAQNAGSPFILLDLGPGLSLGAYEPIEGEPWTATLNRVVGEGETVYLLGDATPFYVMSDVRYNTVYDRWLIEDVIESRPLSPSAWGPLLRERGIDYVVVSFSELRRYAQSGWLPESIRLEQIDEWLGSLSPIEVWSDDNGHPIRAIFRIPPGVGTP